MYSDFHIHTCFSGDCDAPGAAQAQAAINLGMDEICITDHHDYDVLFSPIDFTLDMTAYLPAMRELSESLEGRLRVNIGVELGLQTHLCDYLRQFEARYGSQLDFIIGSSHFVDGQDPYEPEFYQGRTEEAAYRRYFQCTLERVKELDCFDVLGHLDYVVRYGPNKNRYYDYGVYRDLIDPILTVLVQKGKGLECNTAGFKYGLGCPNPCADVFRRYRELGGEVVTMGSDSHAPEYVGYSFESAKAVLQSCGFSYYTVFHGRKPEFIRL